MKECINLSTVSLINLRHVQCVSRAVSVLLRAGCSAVSDLLADDLTHAFLNM